MGNGSTLPGTGWRKRRRPTKATVRHPVRHRKCQGSQIPVTARTAQVIQRNPFLEGEVQKWSEENFRLKVQRYMFMCGEPTKCRLYVALQIGGKSFCCYINPSLGLAEIQYFPKEQNIYTCKVSPSFHIKKKAILMYIVYSNEQRKRIEISRIGLLNIVYLKAIKVAFL